MVPHGIVDAEPDEPAKQQVVIDLLHQLALRADGVEGLQKRGAQKTLRCDRLAPRSLVQPLELGIERDQHIVDDRPDRAQRMLCGYAILEVDIGEQRSRRGIRSAHLGHHCPGGRTESYSSHAVSRSEVQQPANSSTSSSQAPAWLPSCSASALSASSSAMLSDTTVKPSVVGSMSEDC